MATTKEKQMRLAYMLGVIEEAVHEARLAAAGGFMEQARTALVDVPEYIAGVVNTSKIIDAENAAKGKQ